MSIKGIVGKLIRKVIPYMPHKIAHDFIFYRNHRYKLDWENPRTYDEKLTWALVNLFGEREAFYADKYRVREYVSSLGYADLLPKIYGVWEDADSIDFDILPQSFVLKTNHACGEKYYYICKDKSCINKAKVVRKFKKALHSSIWKNQCEYHYKYIKPLVFAEEFLCDGKGDRLTDYKIHCFSGEPVCILVCSNRDQELKLDYYDLEWNYLDVVPENLRSGNLFEKPKGLNQMILAARDLSSKFPTARIDFYDINGKVYFGEITLTPAGGNLHYINKKWQRILGDKIDYSKCKDSFTYR